MPKIITRTYNSGGFGIPNEFQETLKKMIEAGTVLVGELRLFKLPIVSNSPIFFSQDGSPITYNEKQRVIKSMSIKELLEVITEKVYERKEKAD